MHFRELGALYAEGGIADSKRVSLCTEGRGRGREGGREGGGGGRKEELHSGREASECRDSCQSPRGAAVGSDHHCPSLPLPSTLATPSRRVLEEVFTSVTRLNRRRRYSPKKNGGN